MILAKTSDSGLIYALSMIADGNNFLVRFTYQQSANGELLGVDSVEISVAQSDLVDGAWHSLVIAIGQGTALFYRDNTFLTSRYVKMLSYDCG